MLITTLAMLSVASAASFDCHLCGIADCDACRDFDRWVDVTRQKPYPDVTEYQRRYGVWRTNRAKIMRHNAGNSSYRMSLNRFADMTFDEFAKTILMRPIATDKPIVEAGGLDNASQINWLIPGAVPDVLNQGECGSCWAFSTYETLAAHYAIRNNAAAPALSPQELVDCVPASYNCYGCDGGFPNRAMQFVIDHLHDSLERYQAYPYTGVNGACNLTRLNESVPLSATRVVNVTSGSQRELLYILEHNGPVSICVDVTSNFQFYSRGIFTDDTCSSTSLNHAILLYGLYRDPASGRWAYMVRNSWGQDVDGSGTGWGDHGDIYMDAEIDNGNMCGVATLASTVI